MIISVQQDITQDVKLSVCHTEALQKETADREQQWLQELDEEQYESLPEEQKERINQRLREKLRHDNLRYCLQNGHIGHFLLFSYFF